MTPTKDYFNKPRAANYFDGLLLNDPNKLFRKYAVHPGDSSLDYMVPTTDAPVKPMIAPLRIASVEAGAVPADKVVAYGHAEKKSRTASLMTRMEGADCIFLEFKNTVTPGWVPMYYLPWCPGKILSLKIPPLDPTLGGAEPNVFFTAAINGCSIFFQGNPKHPTIYHAGGNPVTTGRDTTLVWRQLVNFLKDSTQGAIGAEINKTHHVTEWHMDPTKPKGTQKSLDYSSYLTTNYKSPTVTVSSVSPWGCVFGYRDNNDDWNFFLQENATVTVETVTGTNSTVQKRTFGKDKVITTNVIATQTYGRPMSIRKIWPNGGGSVKIQAPLPLVLNWSKT
jgi:hypothetical protein